METVIIIILVLIALIGILGIIYISIYNKLQKNLVRIKEAESEIDETLRMRYDILKQMESIINSNTGLNQNNFEELSEENKISNFDFDRKLSKIADNFYKIQLDYPDDLDMESYRKLNTELKITTEKNDAAKTYYNKYTTSLNMLIKKFPSNLIARIHKIDERLYFDNKNMNDEDILDFKF